MTPDGPGCDALSGATNNYGNTNNYGSAIDAAATQSALPQPTPSGPAVVINAGADSKPTTSATTSAKAPVKSVGPDLAVTGDVC